MGLRRILQKKPRLIMRKPPPPSDADAPALKNGWLGLAVLGSILIMAALILLNSRLLRNESAQGRPATQNLCPQSGGAAAGAKASASSALKNRFTASPPRVTFYSELMAPEDQRRIPAGSSEATNREAEACNLPPDTIDPGDPKPAGRTEEANQKNSIGTQTQSPSSGYPNSVPPGARGGAKTYTVQVGAFSHPGIAQQWAMRWKGRGYEVSLKPVARPSGVIYRLYLGSFSSESQADELVRHLKSKEGISALRLVLRN